MSKHVPLVLASKKLGISVGDLMKELKKEGCPYGFHHANTGSYYISSSKLEDYLKKRG